MNTGKTGKIIFLIAGILMVGAFSAFLVNKNMHDPKTHPPVMTFKEEKINFGEVPQGPVVSGEFEFTNTGQSVLIIKKIQPACGCTGLIADEKKEFQPGESGKIKFTFNTEGRNGMNEKTITIESNDVAKPVKVVSFSANILVPQPK
jgi:LPXTG-motif cell wall-anchored protein